MTDAWWAEAAQARERTCEHGIRWPWACHECDDAAWEAHKAALAAGAGTAETNEDLAQSEGRQSGPKGNAQSLSHKYSMKEEPNGY